LSLSKEVIVGIVGLIVLIGSLFLFNSLKQMNLFSVSMIVTAKFDRLDFVEIGLPVLAKGRETGTVAAIYKKGGHYMVDLDLDPACKIPKKAIAEIQQPSVLGERVIALLYDKKCTQNCLADGDIIKGRVNGIKEQAAAMAVPILKQVGKVADIISNDSMGMQALLDQAHQSLEVLEKNTNQFNTTFKQSAKGLPATIKGWVKMTKGLDQSTAPNSSIDSLLQWLGGYTEAEIDSLTKVLYTANEQIPKINGLIDSLQGPLNSANTQIDKVNGVLKGFEKGGDSQVAKLLHDVEFKDSTQLKIENINKILIDIRRNPEKYLSLKKSK